MTRVLKVSLSVIALLLAVLMIFTACDDAAAGASDDAKEALANAEAALKEAEEAKKEAEEAKKEAEEAKKDAEAAIKDAEEAKKEAEEAIKDAGSKIADLKKNLEEAVKALENAIATDADDLTEEVAALTAAIEAAEKAADEALAESIAAAKAELEESIATEVKALEAAIKDKADAKVLSDKVAALTAMIQAAETTATEGDVALKASIKEARAAILAEVDSLLKAHRVEVAGLTAGKASKEEVKKDYEALKALIDNINAATLAGINLEDYCDWTTIAAAYAFELDNIYLEIEEYKELYSDDQWAAIHKAYKIAEVSIYRSFGSKEDTQMADDAFNKFKQVIADNPNPVDVLYYGEGGVLEYINDADKNALKAQALYEKIYDEYSAVSAKAQELLRYYYVINENNELERVDLLLDTLGYWKTEIAADVLALGNTLPVYSTNTKFTEDAANFAAAKAQLAAFTTALNDATFDDGVVADFSASELAKFNRMDAFLTELDDAATGAVALANAVIALQYNGDVVFTYDCVNAINAWNAKCVEWETKFLVHKPANFNTEDGLTENEERFLEIKALIDETRAALDEAKAAVKVFADEYKADAKEFMDIVAKFYESNEDKTLVSDLSTVVTITDGAEINKAYNLALAWIEKYETVIGIAIDYSYAERKPHEVAAEAVTLQDFYINAFDDVVADWEALDHDTLAEYIAGTKTAGIYDEIIFEAVEWYENATGDAYALVFDGAFKNGCTYVGLEAATEEYYNELKKLEAALNELIEAKADAAEELNEALDALAGIKLSTESIIADAEALADAYEVDYDAANALNAERGFVINYGTKIQDAKTKLAAIKAAQNQMDAAEAALEELVVGEAHPYFDATGLTAQTVYQAAIDTLEAKINAFVTANGSKETYTADAEAALAAAKELVRLDDAIDATLAALEELKNADAALVAATAKVSDAPSYFNADIAKVDYVNLKTAVTAKVNAYKATLAASGYAEDTAVTGAAAANVAEAEYILDKEAIYEAYVEFCNDAKAGKSPALASEIDTLFADMIPVIDAYTVEDVADEAKIAAQFSIFKATVNNQIANAGV